MSLIGLRGCYTGIIAVAVLLSQANDCMAQDFPVSVAQVKKELGGKPTDSEDSFVYYEDKIRVEVFEASGFMEVMVEKAGVEMATKLFKSTLFKEEEGKAILDLVKTKSGEKKAGRFEITAKESTIINGMVIMKVTPLPKK